MKMKRILATLVAVLLLALSLTSCEDAKTQNSGESGNDASSQDNPSFSYEQNNSGNAENVPSSVADVSERVSDKASKKDLDAGFDAETATSVTLSGSNAQIQENASGVSLADGELLISEAGTYILSGDFSGRVTVDAPDDADVKLVLNGVNITATKNSAIYVKNADNVVITLPDGSTNTLTDVAEYTFDDTENEEPDACIFSKDDLAINGSGSLEVIGNFHNGIVSKDDLVLVSGNITVNAKNAGIKGKDSITLLGGAYDITAGGDGLKSSNDTEEDKGFIVINGGTLRINSAQDAISSATDLTVTGGEISVKTTGEVSQSGGDFGGGPWGYSPDTEAEDSSVSSKGIKSGTTMYISGGIIRADTTDHSIHSAGAGLICGGEIEISSSAGKGISSHGDLSVTDGKITVTKSTEGIESKAILSVSGGEINITASDDGLNAGGGNSFRGGGFGGNNTDDTATHLITISGGTVYINASGDGIDSNGDLLISGGDVVVEGPTNSGNGFLDCGDGGYKVDISGGRVVACGSTGMLELPDNTCAQNSIFAVVQGRAGDTVYLKDSSGQVIDSITLTKQIGGILFSNADIKTGESYEVSLNDTSVGTAEVSSPFTQIGEGNFGGGFGGQGDFGGGFGGGGFGGGHGHGGHTDMPEGMTPPGF